MCFASTTSPKTWVPSTSTCRMLALLKNFGPPLMLVVADISPLIGLVRIGCVDVLPHLYGSVVIPAEVAVELASPKRPLEVQAFMAVPPIWLSIRSPLQLEPLNDLDAGERAAIS